MESTTPLPRVTISFCTQCKWMLRAAYVSPNPCSSPSTSHCTFPSSRESFSHKRVFFPIISNLSRVGVSSAACTQSVLSSPSLSSWIGRDTFLKLRNGVPIHCLPILGTIIGRVQWHIFFAFRFAWDRILTLKHKVRSRAPFYLFYLSWWSCFATFNWRHFCCHPLHRQSYQLNRWGHHYSEACPLGPKGGRRISW
jgi:hypothetical protein